MSVSMGDRARDEAHYLFAKGRTSIVQALESGLTEEEVAEIQYGMAQYGRDAIARYVACCIPDSPVVDPDDLRDLRYVVVAGARDAAHIDRYLGFGARLLETRISERGVCLGVVTVEVKNARWMSERFASGSMGGRVFEELAAARREIQELSELM